MSAPAQTRETSRPPREQRQQSGVDDWGIPLEGVVTTFITDTQKMQENGQSIVEDWQSKGWTIVDNPKYPNSPRKRAFIAADEFKKQRADIKRIVDHIGGVKPHKLSSDPRGRIDEVDDQGGRVTHDEVVAAAKSAAVRQASENDG